MNALTEPQRRHLTEMLEKPFWRPGNSGEMRCAEGLARRGFLRRHQIPHAPIQYEITASGRAVVRTGGEKAEEAGEA